MTDKSLMKNIHKLENVVDQFVIAFISFGAIVVPIYAIFYSGDIGIRSLGRLMEPWVTMLALMLIARELWFINRKMGNREMNNNTGDNE